MVPKTIAGKKKKRKEKETGKKESKKMSVILFVKLDGWADGPLDKTPIISIDPYATYTNQQNKTKQKNLHHNNHNNNNIHHFNWSICYLYL